MHRLLHLQSHKHTGKTLAHRHTSYRGLLVVVAVFTLALAGIAHTAGADEIVISAKISAQIPTQAAVITSPTDGAVFTSPLATIVGTCNTLSQSIIISIYSDVGFVGSTSCSPSGTFTIPITLQQGTNRLVAKSVNITGDYGPDSIPVTVTYIPPATGLPSSVPDGISAPGKTTPGQAGGNDVVGLKMLSKYSYVTYGPNKDAEWVGMFEGGVSPYTVTIDWGDGIVTSKRGVKTEEIHMSHVYADFHTYFITVTVTDTDGRSLKRQFAAVTPYIPSSPLSPIATPLIDERIISAGIYASLVMLIGLGLLVWTDARAASSIIIGTHGRNRAKKKPARAHR